MYIYIYIDRLPENAHDPSEQSVHTGHFVCKLSQRLTASGIMGEQLSSPFKPREYRIAEMLGGFQGALNGPRRPFIVVQFPGCQTVMFGPAVM